MGIKGELHKAILKTFQDLKSRRNQLHLHMFHGNPITTLILGSVRIYVLQMRQQISFYRRSKD